MSNDTQLSRQEFLEERCDQRGESGRRERRHFLDAAGTSLRRQRSRAGGDLRRARARHGSRP